ncbi:MAG: hypothetical protein U0414_21545 [Polyangiaceae bacterium]
MVPAELLGRGLANTQLTILVPGDPRHQLNGAHSIRGLKVNANRGLFRWLTLLLDAYELTGELGEELARGLLVCESEGDASEYGCFAVAVVADQNREISTLLPNAEVEVQPPEAADVLEQDSA